MIKKVGAILDIDLHSKSVSSQPQNGAEASRRRACNFRRVDAASIVSRRSVMIVDLSLDYTSVFDFQRFFFFDLPA